jgi:mono/diheme cytochrome c family protein
LRSLRAIAVALTVAAASTGCTQIENALARVPFLAFLHSSPMVDPYEMPRPAPPNSVPVRDPFGPAPYARGNTQADLTDLAARSRNPYAANDTLVLAHGRVYYDRFCVVCHGPQGAGDGTILGPGRFPFAPSLVTPTVAGYSDEYVYAVVRQGRGLMPAYGPRMTEAQRWQVVSYVRSLARTGGPAGTAAPGATGQGPGTSTSPAGSTATGSGGGVAPATPQR